MRKNRLLALLLGLVLLLTACGGQVQDQGENPGQEEEKKNEEEVEKIDEDKKIVVRSLKGPTSVGLIKLIDDEKTKEDSIYDMEIVTMADEIVAGLAKKEIDMAAVPANLAAVLYNKTKNVEVVAINTLGVVYLVENSDQIKDFSDLKGKTVYATGEGQTPDLIFRHLLEENKLVLGEDVKVEYKKEPGEVAAILAEKEDSIGLLPQPFISAASMKNEKIQVRIDLNEEWKKANDGKDIVTGVFLVRKDLDLEDGLLDEFLKSYGQSVDFVKNNPDQAAELIDKYDIVKKPVALKALDQLNLVFIEGEEMKEKLSSYLEILEKTDAKAIGGKLPQEDFYHEK